VVTFPDQGGLFTKAEAPSDYFSGEIIRLGQVVGTLKGNYLERLEFDGETYWELETSPIYLSKRPEDPLPSDSRYRADLQWLAKGDRRAAEE
jgi:hypothetical protein